MAEAFKLREDFQLQVTEPGQKPAETPEQAVARAKANPQHCEANEKSKRHLPANLVGELVSGCRFCGLAIERAHPKSTWWSVRIHNPSIKPSKAILRAKKKILRRAFARKDTVGSTRADAKRKAHAYVEGKLGRKVTWKYARKALARMSREERGVANA